MSFSNELMSFRRCAVQLPQAASAAAGPTSCMRSLSFESTKKSTACSNEKKNILVWMSLQCDFAGLQKQGAKQRCRRAHA